MRQRRLARRINKAALVAVAAALALGGTVWAQGPLTVNLDAVDASAHPQMRALVTVIDENGLPVRGLDAKAFELNEDGQGALTPDKVEVVANQKAAVSVMIVVDLSPTMRGKPLQAAKDAIGKFLEALLNEPNDPDRAAFIGFTQNVKVTDTTITDEKREVGFTNDMGKLLNVINFVDVDTGSSGTPLYDAVFRAVKITSQQPGRRVILLMTDGKDQGSTLTASDPIDEANRQRTPIFPIGLSTGQLDTQYLSRLALRTGGQFQSTTTPEELTQLFQNVLAQLKEQYVLTYSSRIPTVDGQSHSLTVQVTTSRGQGISKLTYTLGQPAAPTAEGTASAVGTATPAPASTAAPGGTLAPQPGGSTMQWISDNLVLVIAIAAAAVLFLLMLVIGVVLVLRRRRSSAPQAGYAGAYPQQSFEGATVASASRKATAAGPTMMPANAPVGAPPGRSPASPTVAAPGISSGAGTQLATPGPVQAPPPFSSAPKPFQPATPPPPSPFQPSKPVSPAGGVEKPVTPPTSGGTVLIQRGPAKPKVLGMLVEKKDPAKRFDIDKPAVTVGRAPGNHLVVDHPTVSRQHATIKLEGEDYRLYDLGSANGTFVQGQRVRDPVTLQDGVIVRFGEAEYIFKRVELG
jgi:VWFA-related protein